jgi:hypothetical protein
MASNLSDFCCLQQKSGCIRATGGQLDSTAADKLLENQYVGATFRSQNHSDLIVRCAKMKAG